MIEELKLVVEAVQALGEEARGAFVAWVILAAFRALLPPVTVIICIVIASRVVRLFVGYVTLGGQLAADYEGWSGRQLNRHYDGSLYSDSRTTLRQALKRGCESAKKPGKAT